MKWVLVLLLSGLALYGIGRKIYRTGGAKQIRPFSSFAIVELFTSEGCSSCPPADKLLLQLGASDKRIIPLSFHVDYWDRYGWKDPFSQAVFTARQNAYGDRFKLESIYTPQMIVNGENEFVGSDQQTAHTDIDKALKGNATVNVQVDEVRKAGNKLLVECHLDGDIQAADLIAALVQKQAQVEVKAGENNGAKLTHTNVVRTLFVQACRTKMKFYLEFPKEILSRDVTDVKGWQLILFTQQPKDMVITGAALYDPE